MFDYRIEVKGTEIADNLERILLNERFGVLWTFHLNDKLEEKGLDVKKILRYLKFVIRRRKGSY